MSEEVKKVPTPDDTNIIEESTVEEGDRINPAELSDEEIGRVTYEAKKAREVGYTTHDEYLNAVNKHVSETSRKSTVTTSQQRDKMDKIARNIVCGDERRFVLLASVEGVSDIIDELTAHSNDTYTPDGAVLFLSGEDINTNLQYILDSLHKLFGDNVATCDIDQPDYKLDSEIGSIISSISKRDVDLYVNFPKTNVRMFSFMNTIVELFVEVAICYDLPMMKVCDVYLGGEINSPINFSHRYRRSMFLKHRAHRILKHNPRESLRSRIEIVLGIYNNIQ